MLEGWWQKINRTDRIIDSETAHFDLWKEANDQQTQKFEGMRNITTNKTAGLTRVTKTTPDSQFDWTINEGYHTE